MFDDEFGRMMQDWPKMNEMAQGFTPAIDLYQNDKSVIVETTLAGVDPKDVTISIENDVLTIHGKSEKKQEVDEKNYWRKEIRSGSFFRQVVLPTHVVGDKAEATFENGMLKVEVPKAPEAKPKTIAIKVTDKGAKTKKIEKKK